MMLKHQPLLGVSLLIVVQLHPWYVCLAFSPVVTHTRPALAISLRPTSHHQRLWKTLPLELSADNDNEGDTKTDDVATETTTIKALGAATAIPTDASESTNENDSESPPQVESTTSATPSSSQTIFMLTNEMKRTLIEELGYTRKNVELMRVELGQAAIEKRTQCPPEGMPESWCDKSLIGLDSNASQSAMRKKLENESKYPLKVPLLGASLVLLGKGLSDAGITIIKVNSGFRGASLTEEFMGLPVLAIDFVCIVLGISLGIWTWKTMRDE
jgi:hypothetical protein